MFHAKNYETVSTFGKVMQRKLLPSFFSGHGVLHVYAVEWRRSCGVLASWPPHFLTVGVQNPNVHGPPL